MRKPQVLDRIDKEILRLVSKHPSINQVELAKSIGITQPAISLRLRKLRRMKILNNDVTIDPSPLGLKMLHIDIHNSDVDEVINKVRRCPMIINCYLTEDNTVSMVAIGEDKEFLNCMLIKHIRSLDKAEVRSRNIVESIKGINYSIDIDQRLEFTPCGDGSCKECEYYVDNGGRCVGCPLTIHYKGRLWSSNH